LTGWPWPDTTGGAMPRSKPSLRSAGRSANGTAARPSTPPGRVRRARPESKSATLTIERLELARLKPHPRNPRQHPEPGSPEWSALRDSLQHDYFDPLVWNRRNGLLVSGHLRAKVLAELGFSSADCVVVNYDEPTHLARLVSGNYQNGADDDALLAQLLAEVADMDPITGISGDELRRLLADAHDARTCEKETEPRTAEALALQKKWRTKPGQVWALEQHRVWCGDSSKPEELNAFMRGNKADIVFTDPPYNLAGKNGLIAAAWSPAMAGLKAAKWDKDFKPGQFMRALPMADDVTVYVCTSHHLAGEIWAWMATWSDHFSYCVFSKPAPMPSLTKRHWTWSTELIAYATRGKHTFNFPDEGHALSVWTIAKTRETEHPTEKPIEVPAHAIRHSSKPGALVFDGFLGSGSTLIACENLDRVCYGVEIDPAYVAVVLERWAEHTGQEPELLVPKLKS